MAYLEIRCYRLYNKHDHTWTTWTWSGVNAGQRRTARHNHTHTRARHGCTLREDASASLMAHNFFELVEVHRAITVLVSMLQQVGDRLVVRGRVGPPYSLGELLPI